MIFEKLIFRNINFYIYKILQSIDSLEENYSQLINVFYALDECGRRLDYNIYLMWSDNKFHQA